ncbi:unnamed protein product [Cunninghamella echinulata]
MTLNHKVHNEEATIDVLMDICNRNFGQYKRILEALTECETNTMRINTSGSISINPLRTIDSETKRKTDMKWASDFIKEHKIAKIRMSWQINFVKGREAGYFKTYINAQNLKNTYKN